MNNSEMDRVHVAVMRRSLPEVVRAIADGDDVDSPDREGRTALFYAAKDGDSAIVAELLRQGADVSARDKVLETPLHFASRAYQPRVVEMLLSHGAVVDAQDFQGNSALARAVFESRGRAEVIRLLLAAGARKSLKNKHGVSPEDLAKMISNYDVAVLLTAGEK